MDLVVCSTAVRARATAEPIVEVLGCPVHHTRAIYEEGLNGLVDLIRGLPDEATTVLIVGHNPGMERVTSVLTGTHVPYPTAALGTILLSVPRWQDIKAGSGSLDALVTPADLGG